MKFIYGQEEFLVNNEVKKIITGSVVEPNIFNQDDSLDSIISEIQTISMFTDTKLIIIKNHPILTDSMLGMAFLAQIQGVDESVELVFVLEEEKLSKSNELIKYLLKEATLIELNKIDSKNIVPLIKELVNEKGGTITSAGAIKLAQKLPANLRLIVMEIEKLLLQSLAITDEMVEVSVAEQSDEDYFALPNAIAANDKRSIVKAYKERLSLGEQPMVIISQIASMLNLSALVASYRKQGLSSQDISDLTKIHIYRIKKANDLLNYSSIDNINNLLIDLGKLDKDIKTGQVEDEQGLDAFILKLLK